MKKIILISACLLSATIAIHAQTAKWFVGFPTGYVLGGPASSIKSLMTDQGYDQTSAGLFGAMNFPSKSYIPPLMVMAGKQISSFGSLYILAGNSNASTVEGYDGYNSISVQLSDIHETFFNGKIDMTGGKLSMVSALLGLNFVFRK